MADVPTFHGDGDDALAQSQTLQHTTDTMITLDVDNPCLSDSDWTLASINNIPTMDPLTVFTKSHADKGKDTTYDNPAVQQRQLRSRNSKEAAPATKPAQTRRGVPSTRPNDSLNYRPGSTRPVIYAGPRNESKTTRTTHPSVLNYTIDDLVKGSQMDPTSLPPAVSTSHFCICSHTNVPHRYMHLSLIQPETYLSRATSQHNTMNYCLLHNF